MLCIVIELNGVKKNLLRTIAKLNTRKILLLPIFEKNIKLNT